MDGFLGKGIIKTNSRKGRNIIEYINRRYLKGSHRSILYMNRAL